MLNDGETMKQQIFEITGNDRIAKNTYLMRLSGDTAEITRPGQFVNIRLDGKYLRRPISVCDRGGEKLTLIYKAVGSGTKMMSQMEPGKKLDLLVGLGNGYDTGKSGERPLLIGGGAGVPPLYLLCRELISQGKHPRMIMGFGSAEEVFFEDEFRRLGAHVAVTTADGSRGTRGFVTDALHDGYTYVYTCGPEPMLRAVYGRIITGGQFSFEERMGCGFGACMGCSCRTKYGYRRICRDGPVLEKEEIIW